MHPAHLTVQGVQPNAAPQTAPNPRLVKAAHEFEGQMMKELLQPMMEGSALDGGEGGDDDDSSGLGLGSGSGSGGALAEFASQSLGQALSERGGFGIANQIIRELGRAGNPKSTNKVTLDLHRNTVMRKLK
jgi:Rod binding domain-containing protein